jgi:hypothetical protein
MDSGDELEGELDRSLNRLDPNSKGPIREQQR